MEPVETRLINNPDSPAVPTSSQTQSDDQFANVFDAENLKLKDDPPDHEPVEGDLKGQGESVLATATDRRMPGLAVRKESRKEKGHQEIELESELKFVANPQNSAPSVSILTPPEADRQHLPKQARSALETQPVLGAIQLLPSLVVTPIKGSPPEVTPDVDPELGVPEIAELSSLGGGDTLVAEAALPESNLKPLEAGFSKVISRGDSQIPVVTEPGTLVGAVSQGEPLKGQAKTNVAQLLEDEVLSIASDDQNQSAAVQGSTKIEEPSLEVNAGDLKKGLQSVGKARTKIEPGVRNASAPKMVEDSTLLKVIKAASFGDSEKSDVEASSGAPAIQKGLQEVLQSSVRSAESVDVGHRGHSLHQLVIDGRTQNNDARNSSIQTRDSIKLAINSDKIVDSKMSGQESKLVNSEPKTFSPVINRDENSNRSASAIATMPVEQGSVALPVTSDRSNAVPLPEAQTVTVVPSPSNQLAHVEKANVISQLIEKAHLVTGKNQSEVTVSLKPEILGRINLRASMVHDSLVATIVAESPQVKQLLESQMTTLQTALHDQGLQVTKIEVVQGSQLSFSEFGHEQPGSQQQHFNSPYDSSVQAFFPGIDDEPVMTDDEGPRPLATWGMRTSGSLNLLA